jgi:carboxyl-terminal processing protease
MSIFSNDQSNKPLNIWLPLLFGVVLAVGIMLGFTIEKSPNGSYGNSSSSQRLDELIRFVEAKYVDDVNSGELVDGAIESILKKLDPHSNYIPAYQLSSVNEELDGNFEGIGVQFIIKDDTIYVVSAISGGPSEAQGIRAGDKIVEIEDSVVAGVEITNEQIIKKLKGEKGTKVNVKIKRGNKKKLIPFTITRDKIPLYSVDAGYMLNENTGYIKISRFSATTHQEFVSKIQKLEKEGLENIVIDLRQNPGGYLTAATKILDQIFSDAKMLVYTEGRSYKKSEYKSTGRTIVDIGKVSLLIDEGSASASEIMAGAIQDWDRGSIIGRRSFGKGLVQEQYMLSNGAALRLTVARYYTPSGRSIQKPYDDGRDKYNKEMYTRQASGELDNQDSISVGDTTKYFTASNRVVYGGGGITPDYFISIDKSFDNDYFLEAAQHIAPFVYEHLDTKRDFYAQYDAFKGFNEKVNINDDLLNEFTKYAVENGVKLDKENFNKCKSKLAQLMKANIAKQFFELDGFFKVLYEDDKMIEKALETMK